MVLDGEKAVVDIITSKEKPGFGVFEQLAKLQETIKNKKELNIFKGFMDTKNNEDVKNKSSEFMKTIGKTLNINIPILGSAGELFGVKRPVDILWSKAKRNDNKFLNGLLKMFGYKKWVQWLHESYIEEQVKWSDMAFAKDCFIDYQKNEKTDIPEKDSTRAICGLEDIVKEKKPEEITKIKAKIPQDYNNLKSTIIKTLPNHINKLSINTVRMIDPTLIITKDKQEVIDVQKIQSNPDEFVDAYLKTSIWKFVDSWDEFIDSKKVDSDAFAVALFGNLTWEKFFVEWVNLWIITAAQMWKIETKPNTDTNVNTALEKKKLNELNFEEAKTLATKVFGAGPATDLLIAMSKNNSAMILRTIALWKHEWGLAFGRKNKDMNRGQINIGTFQISAQPNEIVAKRNKQLESGKKLLNTNNITYDETYFKKITKYEDETGDTPTKKAQTDLLCWLGYIQNDRWWEKTFTKLADGSLSENEVKGLISNTIQWWISEIGKDVVAQINTASTDKYTQIA